MAGALVSLIAVGASAVTGPVGSDGIVHGCVSTRDGDVRIVGASTSCSKSETAIAWNQTGPKGATGAQGPAGAVGPAGATGAQGPRGADGATGPAGAKGDKGDAGGVGAAGAVGAQGPQGPAGPQGRTGEQGPQGAGAAQVIQHVYANAATSQLTAVSGTIDPSTTLLIVDSAESGAVVRQIQNQGAFAEGHELQIVFYATTEFGQSNATDIHGTEGTYGPGASLDLMKVTFSTTLPDEWTTLASHY